MLARGIRDQSEDYVNDLLYMNTKANYKKFEAEPPSAIRRKLYSPNHARVDARSGAEILEDVKKMFRKGK